MKVSATENGSASAGSHFSGSVVVTGASSGIGAACVRELAARGFQVFGTVRRVEDRSGLQEIGVVPLQMDVTDEESISRARATVTDALGARPLVGLVNNAGVAAAGPIELTPVEELRRVLAVNVVGVAAVTQAFLPALRAARGRVVNVSSVSGRLALPFLGYYAASKFALEALSDSLRRELRGTGVEVIVIQPGTVRTRIWDGIAATDLAAFRGSLYETRLERVRELALEGAERGLPASAVAEAVAEALVSRRPPARKLVLGGSGLVRRVTSLLPARWTDRLIEWRLERR